MVNDRLTVLLTGDVAFFYDSNALWNNYLPEKLTNRCIQQSKEEIYSDIFRDHRDTGQLEEFFESHHRYKAEHIAGAFDVNYYSARQ
jgi:2-succinyl-5-enolpyruvyl-6-hydroxy-3-cyclohexene-1-carboxylate synthase